MWFFIVCPPGYLKVVNISYFSLNTLLPAVLVENHKFSKNQQMVRLFQITNLMHNSFILQQYVCYTKILMF